MFLNGFLLILTFIPQLITLFIFLAIIENCGYMTRIAFILDGILNYVGLSGKFLIATIIGTGCSVPAIMSCRTIDNIKEKKLVMILIPMIPCSAKLTVFTFFIVNVFHNRGLILLSLYLISFLTMMGVILLLNNKKNITNYTSSLLLEMPDYEIPKFNTLYKSVLGRVWSFVRTAGITVCIMSMLLWFLGNLHFEDNITVLEMLARTMTPLFKPLGFDRW